MRTNYLEAFERQEVHRTQFIFALAAILEPIWYFLTQIYFPEQYDYLWPRLALSLVMLVYIFFLERLPRDKWRRDLILLPSGIILCIHGLYMTCANHWHAQHVLGVTLIICVSYTMIHTKKAAWLFSSVIAVAALFFCLIYSQDGYGSLHLLWVSVIISAAMLASYGRLKTIHELISAEANSSLILRYMTDGIVICDQKIEVLFANTALINLFNIPIDQIYGLTPETSGLKAYKDDETEAVIVEWPSTQAVKTKRPVSNVPIRLERSDGTSVHVIVTAVPIIDELTNAVTRVFMTFQDVTQIRAAEQSVREHQTMITNSAKLRALGEMAGGIAHEINTPLGTIGINAEIIDKNLKDPKLNKQQIQSAVETIRLTVERIAKIIRGMRALVNSNNQDPLETVQIKDIVELLKDLGQERLLRDKITLYVDCPEDFEIRCRPKQITQLLLNLLNNSFDFLQTNARTEARADRWIKFEIRRGITQTEIAVLDSGPGVPASHREKIWQPFFTTKGVGQGLGLSLSIARRIAEDHGGALTYEPDGDTTRFILRLPFKIQTALKKTG